MNHLKPNIKTTKWTDTEDIVLLQKRNLHGNKWTAVARSLPGRTESQVKNRFYWLAKTAQKKQPFKEVAPTELLERIASPVQRLADKVRRPSTFSSARHAEEPGVTEPSQVKTEDQSLAPTVENIQANNFKSLVPEEDEKVETEEPGEEEQNEYAWIDALIREKKERQRKLKGSGLHRRADSVPDPTSAVPQIKELLQ